MTKALELRVHGVSGTAPESLLDRPLVTQVSGDAIAGFYRPRLPAERTDDRAHPFDEPVPGAPDLEGYNWGGLTSGSPGRALWLFLLPFTLINIAPRARPLAEDDSPRLAYLTWLFSRWLALGLTLLLVVTTAGIGVNLAGWQCSYSNACPGAGGNALVGRFFGTWKDGARDGGLPPGLMLLLGALVPLVMLLVLWLVSKRTLDRYESVRTKGLTLSEEDPGANEIETNLESRWMWRNARAVRRLRATHMQAGVAAVIWVAAEAVSSVSLIHLVAPWHWGRSDGWSIAVAVLTGAVLVYSFVTLVFASYTGHRASSGWQTASIGVWLALVLAAVLVTVDLVSGEITRRSKLDKDGRHSDLPGFDGNLWAVVVLMFVLLLMLIVVVGLQAARTPRRPPPGSEQAALAPGLKGMGAAGLATAAVLVGAVLSSSAYTVAATWLNTGTLKPKLSEVSAALGEFAAPDSFRMANFVFVVAAVAAAVVVAVAGLLAAWGFVSTSSFREAVANDYGPAAGTDDPANPHRNARRRGIERAMYLGALLEKGLVVVGLLITAGVVLTYAGFVVLVGHVRGWSWAETAVERTSGKGVSWIPDDVQAWGAFGAVLSLLALVTVASLAFRVPATRRSVGILWDVASFWPRAAHPLAAPCYAERTVPDLVTRLHHLRSEDDQLVVLAAHSQGTVLSAAALFSLSAHPDSEPAVRGISLLTFGCVLRRLYARFFPVYFGVHRLHDLKMLLTTDGATTSRPRWTNLWRYTDYLGGQVTAGPPQVVPVNAPEPSPGLAFWEWHSPDPPYFDRRPGWTTYSLPGRHSNFWSDRSGIFQKAVVNLVEETRVSPPDR